MKKIEKIILDMDGTLYQLDGKNNCFQGSTLEKTVVQNALTFIKKMENCESEIALETLNQGLADPIGLSTFLSKRYDITREQYFAIVWNINPTAIVKNFEIAIQAIKVFKELELELALLTSAPAAWQKKVFEFLKIESYFSEIYTGECFGNKIEVFKKLAKTKDPKKILSVGDQEKTDILPAMSVGMQTFLVKNPDELQKLTTIFRRETIYEK